MKKSIFVAISAVLTCLISITPANAWKNGPSGHSLTSSSSDCVKPPFGTHDYIADKALNALPDKEGNWLKQNKEYFLLGTEAPDNKPIPSECKTPNRGYKDMGKNNHSVRWDSKQKDMDRSGAANRAQEEYNLAVKAYKAKKYKEAAYYLGAMSHYISDVSSFPHSYDIADKETHDSYESWVNKHFDSLEIKVPTPEKRVPYDAVVNISKAVVTGKCENTEKDTPLTKPTCKATILPASKMDSSWSSKPSAEYTSSIKNSLSFATSELADVLHNFYMNVVATD